MLTVPRKRPWIKEKWSFDDFDTDKREYIIEWPPNPEGDPYLRTLLKIMGWTATVEDKGGDTLDVRIDFGESFYQESDE